MQAVTHGAISRLNDRLDAVKPAGPDSEEFKRAAEAFVLIDRYVRAICADNGTEPPAALEAGPPKTSEQAAALLRVALDYGIGRSPCDQ